MYGCLFSLSLFSLFSYLEEGGSLKHAHGRGEEGVGTKLTAIDDELHLVGGGGWLVMAVVRGWRKLRAEVSVRKGCRAREGDVGRGASLPAATRSAAPVPAAPLPPLLLLQRVPLAPLAVPAGATLRAYVPVSPSRRRCSAASLR